MLVSNVQLSESVVHIPVSTLLFFRFFYYIGHYRVFLVAYLIPEFVPLAPLPTAVLAPSLFRSSTHFLIGFFVFLILNCMSCLYILEISPLLVASFAIIFSHSEGCLLISFIVFFAVHKF